MIPYLIIEITSSDFILIELVFESFKRKEKSSLILVIVSPFDDPSLHALHPAYPRILI